MRKSRIVVININKNSNTILENVLQATIVNKGTKNVEIFGQILEPNDPPFRIDPTGTVTDLELNKIVFLENGSVSENHIAIAYQVLVKEVC